jgi:hypothetical protein
MPPRRCTGATLSYFASFVSVGPDSSGGTASRKLPQRIELKPSYVFFNKNKVKGNFELPDHSWGEGGGHSHQVNNKLLT